MCGSLPPTGTVWSDTFSVKKKRAASLVKILTRKRAKLKLSSNAVDWTFTVLIKVRLLKFGKKREDLEALSSKMGKVE